MTERIAIVGAGPAGLATAFHLTDPDTNPGWQDRYSVDVYTLGWRVGGKGATGRNPDAGERIEEHGIHVFGNMYFNSLRMMGACYEQVEWDHHDRHRTMEEAFLPSLSAYESEYWDGRWHGEMGNFPFTDSVPWEGPVWPDERGRGRTGPERGPPQPGPRPGLPATVAPPWRRGAAAGLGGAAAG